MTSVRHSTISVNGIRIHIAEQGKGPLVLLVHGFPEIWYSWRHRLPALADAGYRAAAIDPAFRTERACALDPAGAAGGDQSHTRRLPPDPSLTLDEISEEPFLSTFFRANRADVVTLDEVDSGGTTR